MLAEIVADRRWFLEGQSVKVQVAGDKEIQASVVIEVAKGASGMPFRRLPQARCFAHLGKSAVPVVSVQQVKADGGDQNVGVAVVVVISGVRAGSPIWVGKSGLLRDILEMPVAFIVIQVNAARYR